MNLRPYQRDALDALYRDWDTGHQRIGISCPTGTGKTVIMSHLAHEHRDLFAADHTYRRVLILVHTEELVKQTVAKLLAVDRSVSVGVVKARENRAGAAVVVASIQTACRPKRLAQLGNFGLIICDESHLSMSDQWQKTLTALGAQAGLATGPRIAGFSATWSRGDNRQLGSFWEKISYELSTEWAIGQGFLVRPIGKYIKTDIRLDDVKKTAGDYNDRDMAKKLTKEAVRDAVVAGYLEFAKDRIGVCFAPTVDTAEFFRPAFEEAGIITGGLYGTTGKEESTRLFKAHRAGDIQLLMSCTRLSTGWDEPQVSAGIIARPTTHKGFFIQMVGRLLRICDICQRNACEHKRDAIVLDPTGVLFKFDLEGLIDLSTSERPSREDSDGDDENEPPERGTPDEGVFGVVSGFEDVALFGRTDANWQRTAGGTRFIYAKGELAFVVPTEDPDRVHVGACPAHDVGAGRWLATAVTPTEANIIGASWARDRDPIHTTTTGRWRRLLATERQKQRALAAGAIPGQVWRKRHQGDIYDLTCWAVASRTLDGVQSWQ